MANSWPARPALLASWLRRLSALRPPPWVRLPAWFILSQPRVTAGLALAMIVWGATDVRNRAIVDLNNTGLHKTDLTVYTEAGAAFFDGRDPYAVTNLRGWGYLYPPLFALLVAPLHAFHPQTQTLVWFTLSVLMAWGCYRQCVRIARVVLPDEPERGAFGPIPNSIGMAALLAALLPALNCLQRGQVGIGKMFFLLWGFRLLIENRSVARSLLAGAILALPIVLKITPLVPVSFVLFQQFIAAWHLPARRAALSRVGGCALGVVLGLAVYVFLLPASLIGWQANLHHLDTWYGKVAARAEETLGNDFAGDSTSERNQSFTNGVHRLGNWAHYYFAGGPYERGPEQLRLGGPGLLMDAPLVDALLLAARVAAGCLLLVLGYRMARDHDLLGQAAAFGLSCAATLVVATIARGHYYVLMLPAVMFTSAWLLAHRRPAWALTSAAVPGLLVVAHYAFLDTVGRVGTLGIGAALWYATMCVTLLRIKRHRRECADAADRWPATGGESVYRFKRRDTAGHELGTSHAQVAHRSSTELSR